MIDNDNNNNWIDGASDWIFGDDSTNNTSGEQQQNAQLLKELGESIDWQGVWGGIGDIFANGLNFSCYNSTFTPKKAVHICETMLKPWFNQKVSELDAAVTLEQKQLKLNHVITRAYMIEGVYKQVLHNANWRSCSRDALNKVFIPFGEKLVESTKPIIDVLKQNYNVSQTSTRQENNVLEIPEYGIKEWGKSGGKVSIPVYKMSKKSIISGGGLASGSQKLLGGSFLWILVILGGLWTMVKTGGSPFTKGKKKKYKFKSRK